METADRLPFFQLLDDTCDAIGSKVISGGGKAIMFEDLQHFSLELVRQALAAHRRDPQRGQWQPNTAHVEYQIQRRQPVKWINADEAYALLPRGEDAPGLLNQVTSVALAAAAPFLAQRRPDENAARMAFRASYNRLVEQEVLAGRLPRHWVSPAGSIEAQNAVREEGLRLGLLNATWTLPAAPQIGHSIPSPGALESLKGYKFKALPPLGSDE